MNPGGYPMGVAPPPPSGGRGGSGYPSPPPPGAQGYPGYPQSGYPGYPSQPGYPGGPPAPGFQPQSGYPSQPGYPAPSGYPSQPGYPAASPPAPGFQPPPSGFAPPQPGYPAAGYPAGYPAPGGAAPPNQPYPGQSPYPVGGCNPPPAGFNPGGGYPGYPQPGAPSGNPAAAAGYPGYPQPGGLPGQPINPSAPSQAQYAQQSSDGPNDYNSSIEYLYKMSKEELTEEGRRAFYNLAGQDAEIDAFELKDILNKVFQRDFKFEGFTIDMTRSMVAMSDYDMSGKLNFEDFRLLWSDLASCKKAFIALDTDNSGHFNRSEFHKGLNSIGINIADRVLRPMVMRYSDKDGNIRFNDFVACYIKLKIMTKTFRAKDVYNQGIADFDRDEYVQLCMYS